DDEWAQCLRAATRVCVLRHSARVAEAIDDTRLRAQNLCLIAEAQFKAALPIEAAATLNRGLLLVPSIADQRFADEVLRDINKTQAKAGKLGAALKTARSITSEYLRAAAIGSVAVAIGEAGSIPEALQLVRAIDNKRLRRLQIREVAWELRSLALARGEDGAIVAVLKE